jgi:hypothetical protein
MNEFERYVGIKLGDEQLINDVSFALLCGLLALLAIVFHSNRKLFGKMFNEAFYNKNRNNIFDDSKNSNEWLFNGFMTFQALMLSSIIIYSAGKVFGYASQINTWNIFISVGLIFLMVLLFFLGRRIINLILGYVFANEEQYDKWKKSNDAVRGVWGLSLYIPAIWILFGDTNHLIPIYLFCILYLAGRILIAYKSIHIFSKRNNGILYINLYLCTLEILPLFVLYDGLVFLYNIIEESSLWH